MTEPAADPAVRAAMSLWEPLAALAWGQYCRLGRGLLIVDRDDLLAAHTRHDRDEAAEQIATYFPAEGVPRGDDYRGVLEQYDPQTQILVLIGRRGEGDETLLAIEASGEARPSPEVCFERQRASPPPPPGESPRCTGEKIAG